MKIWIASNQDSPGNGSKNRLAVNAVIGQIQWTCGEAVHGGEAVHANMNIAKRNRTATIHVRYNLAYGPLWAVFCLRVMHERQARFVNRSPHLYNLS